MKIRPGMEIRHAVWVQKMSSDQRGAVILEIVELIDSELESEVNPRIILDKYFLKNRKLSLSDKTKIALAIAVLSANGDNFRFEWNRHYGGAGWADAMEILDKKEIYNPVR